MKSYKKLIFVIIGCAAAVAIVVTMAFVLWDISSNASKAYSSDDVVEVVTSVHKGSVLKDSSDTEVAGDECVTDYIFEDASGMEYHVLSGVERIPDDFGRATDSFRPYIVDEYANAYFQSQEGHDALMSVLSETQGSVSVTEDNGVIVDIRIVDEAHADSVRTLLHDEFGAVFGSDSKDSLDARCNISVYIGNMDDIQMLTITSLSEFVVGEDVTE